jgi:dTDP-4-amino-4,6-dideoxygalactose transaminase
VSERPVAPIPFIDLAAQRARLGDRIEAAIGRVLDHGRFILGPEVAQLEAELGAFCGAKHVISCANGTDALVLAMMALEIGPGDAVLVPSFTFSASAESVVLAGATPVFVDVLEDTFNIDPAGLVGGLEAARAAGLKPRAVMTVDLFGQPADYNSIVGFCGENGLYLIADAAQSFGGSYAGSRVGTLGAISTTSFFPAKPFACYGDGGALFTEDDDVDALLRSLRVHGQGTNKYDNVRIGMNSRLDSLQAAILMEKLSIFEEEIEMRQVVAGRYETGFAGVADRLIPPLIIDAAVSVWALYTVRIGGGRRDAVQAALSDLGIPSAAYYPRPLHQQPAYAKCPRAADVSVSRRICEEVLSLPMHPYMDAEAQEIVMHATRQSIISPGPDRC